MSNYPGCHHPEYLYPLVVRNKAAHEAKTQPDDTDLIIKLTAGSL